MNNGSKSGGGKTGYLGQSLEVEGQVSCTEYYKYIYLDQILEGIGQLAVLCTDYFKYVYLDQSVEVVGQTSCTLHRSF